MNRVKNIYSNKYIKKYEKKIKLLGSNSKLNIDSFLLSRLIISIISIPVVILFHILYTNILIDNKIRIRSDNLYNEAIVFFNMLKMAYIKENDLKISIEMVSYKLNNSITYEFKKKLGKNKFNNDIIEVLNKVIETIPNDDVRASLIDLMDSDDYLKEIDNIISHLQNKNAVLIKQKYEFKPLLLGFSSIIVLAIITVVIFNINNIYDYLVVLFK